VSAIDRFIMKKLSVNEMQAAISRAYLSVIPDTAREG
jgi:hypothetical protein